MTNSATQQDHIVHIFPPKGSLDLLSQMESNIMQCTATSEVYQLFRSCLLAVLNTGSITDDSAEIFNQHKDFSADILRTERGIKLKLTNPPKEVFVDGELTELIRRNLFSVLRDILFVRGVSDAFHRYTPSDPAPKITITDVIFSILRNANALTLRNGPDLIVCWGGHSINNDEYQYGRELGYELGLRRLNICTGSGPGAMEAPMRGAAVGHAQQAYKESRFIGVTEPSIIAAEPPNSLVNELIIMPDIEKRLETFVRMGHGIIILPGGVGTAEEFLYILGLLMQKENRDQYLPLILTGPKESHTYFEQLDQFVRAVLGEEVTQYYEVIIDNPQLVAQKMSRAMPKVKEHRKAKEDLYTFNWTMHIPKSFQTPFIPTFENMRNLNLRRNQPIEQLAANLRCAFSGIVAGNVKEVGMREVATHGPFELHGDPDIMHLIDELLESFVAQGRMKLPGTEYQPCYTVIRD